MVDYPNIFATGMNAFDAQTKRLNAFDEQRASKTAGAAIADGDYTGGANVFNRAGMVGEAQDVQARQLALQDRQTAATNTAEDRATKAKALAADNLLRAVDAIQSQPEGQRLPWIQRNAADLKTLGLPVDQFAGKTEADVSDASIAGLKAALGKPKEDYTIGSARYSGSTNKPLAGFVETDPRKMLQGVGDAPPPPSGSTLPATPVLAPPAPLPDAVPATANTPRATRNNNPLNLTTLPSGQWNGQTGADGRFATFSTPEAGIAAADKNLAAYSTHHGIDTLAGIINRWAPSGDGANDPQAYIATVSKDTGIDPNQKLDLADPKVRAVILHSMAKVEGGPSSASAPLQGGASMDTVQPPPAPAALPGFHIVSQAKPEWADLGDGRQRNIITGKVEGKANEPDELPLNPQAVAMVGAQYLRLGPDALKNMGQGKAGVHNKNMVMEWVAKTAEEAGTSNPQLVERFAQNKANLAALTQNTKSLAAVSASEHTLDANFDLAMSYAKRGVGPTGVPVFDTPINKLRESLGSADAKNLDNLLTTTTNEYARILTTATGTGAAATSDSARAEAHRLINNGMSLHQLTDAIKIAKAEASNRKMSYVGEGARLSSEISGIPQAPMAPPPPPAAPSGWGAATVVRH